MWHHAANAGDHVSILLFLVTSKWDSLGINSTYQEKYEKDKFHELIHNQNS